jgi:hypothetical protein
MYSLVGRCKGGQADIQIGRQTYIVHAGRGKQIGLLPGRPKAGRYTVEIYCLSSKADIYVVKQED